MSSSSYKIPNPYQIFNNFDIIHDTINNHKLVTTIDKILMSIKMCRIRQFWQSLINEDDFFFFIDLKQLNLKRKKHLLRNRQSQFLFEPRKTFPVLKFNYLGLRIDFLFQNQ